MNEHVIRMADGTLTVSMLESINFKFKTELTCAEYSKKVPYPAFLPIAPGYVEAFIHNMIEEKTLTIIRPSGGYVKDAFIKMTIPIKLNKMSKTVEVQLELSEGETPELTRDQAMNVMAHRLSDLEAKIAAMERIPVMSEKALFEKMFITYEQALDIKPADLFAFLRMYYPEYDRIARKIPDTDFFKTQRQIMTMTKYDHAWIETCCNYSVMNWQEDSPFKYSPGIGIPHHVIQTYRSLRTGISNKYAKFGHLDEIYFIASNCRFIFLWGNLGGNGWSERAVNAPDLKRLPYGEGYLDMGDFVMGMPADEKNQPETDGIPVLDEHTVDCIPLVFQMDRSMIEHEPMIWIRDVCEIEYGKDLEHAQESAWCSRVHRFKKWW